MNDIVRAFLFACRDILKPKVLWLSFRPFLLTAIFWSIILWFTWNPLLDWTKLIITQSWLSGWISKVLTSVGWEGVRAIMSPYLTAIILMPFIIITLIVIISYTSMTAVVALLEQQKYYLGLRRGKGGSFLGSLWNTIGLTVLALLLLTLSFPLWWIPPLFSLIPPCIWGWLTARLMSYDLLSIHAEKSERINICEERRYGLLLIGILSGLLGAVPSFFWLSSVFVLILFPFVSLFMMWVYSLIFIFVSLWFGHYLLFALRVDRQLRGESL